MYSICMFEFKLLYSKYFIWIRVRIRCVSPVVVFPLRIYM